MPNEYDVGMGTTPGMWEFLSDLLAEHKEKLPYSLNNAIYALREGEAKIVHNSHLTELSKDAARYRCLRSAGAWQSELRMDELSKDPDKFDAEVDVWGRL